MNYEPGNIVTYRTYGCPYGDRRVRVTSKGNYTARGDEVRPAFKGIVLEGPEEGMKVLGYDKQIIKVEANAI